MEEKQKSGKKSKVIIGLIIAIILIAVVVCIVLAILNNKPKSNVQITSTDDMQNLVKSVYEGQEQNLPGTLTTQVIDINNLDVLKSYTGLTSNENIDAAIVSEPLIGSQAYSFVLVKVKDGADSNEIAKQMSEQVDTRKWVCVEAEKLYATSIDNLAILVMASDEWATPVYNKLKEILGAHGEEYVKENQSAFEEQLIADGV